VVARTYSVLKTWSFIINDTWYKQKKAASVVYESLRIVKAAAKLISAEIQELPNNIDSYPTAADITDEAQNQRQHSSCNDFYYRLT
jgi:hypothetical protein